MKITKMTTEEITIRIAELKKSLRYDILNVIETKCINRELDKLQIERCKREGLTYS